MKKLIFVFVGLFTLISLSFSQKYAFVDTEYVLNNIPTYKAAQEELDKKSQEFQLELETINSELQQMFKDYQAERVLLTEEMKTKRKNEILRKEQKLKELQQKYFGPEGNLFKKQEELIKPIQDQIYDAVNEIAKEQNLAFVYDTAGGGQMIYANPKYDISDLVLEKLGYKN